MYEGERFNSITHLVGSLAALTGLIVLIVTASRQGDVLPIISVSIYGITLALLYITSTLYHSLQGNAKIVFQKLDHLAIYLLIAGTYTPFALISLGKVLGWVIFGVVWGLAVLGIILELSLKRSNRLIPLIIYLTMGWLIIVAIKPFIQALGMTGFGWVLLGGLSYTFGVIFYVYDEKYLHFHGIWHLFVLAGSSFQYFAIFNYIL
ncbi:MAG: hemolysin III [Desulforhopalus sp.]|jgi:hemolysin III